MKATSHFELGDIYYFDVGFDDEEDSFKNRPVIIIQKTDEYYILVQLLVLKYMIHPKNMILIKFLSAIGETSSFRKK